MSCAGAELAGWGAGPAPRLCFGWWCGRGQGQRPVDWRPALWGRRLPGGSGGQLACCVSLTRSPPPHANALSANQPAGVWKASAALLGDVASTLTSVGVLFQQKPFVQPFLQQLGQDSATADTANWASQMIQKALRG